jgi:cardiolipin synthase
VTVYGTGAAVDQLLPSWQWVVSATTIALDAVATAHAVLNKRDTRAVIGWVGVIWLTPFVGAFLYFLFGVNRIRRKARRLRRLLVLPRAVGPATLDANLPSPGTEHLGALVRLVGNVTGRPLLPGNRVVPLTGGDVAYPEMLGAIRAAERSVALCSYIFDNDPAGRLFADTLAEAVARGVEVRVLIDAVGSHYTWPSIVRYLRRGRVPVARFLPQLVPWYFPYANLRNHRKILVVDGRVGFTGGMNIREGHDPTLKPRHPIRDLHFRLDGPVVGRLQEVFADDWEFVTGEVLQGDRWFVEPEAAGPVLARCVPSGPDDDFEQLRTTFLGALSCARRSVRIMTPYFLPDSGLTAALNVAALRGVEVDILLPQRNNLRLVQWASTAELWQVLEQGCRVWLVPPPFDHTKLMLVDGAWSLIGSANWDPRSMRLNFELDVECYDRELAEDLESLVRRKMEKAIPVTLADVEGRSLPVKLRDGVARLFTPYL